MGVSDKGDMQNVQCCGASRNVVGNYWSMFMQIICDPASPTEEVSISFFMNLLQIIFPNNVLVSKFHNECG